jgi:uncharacterized protein
MWGPLLRRRQVRRRRERMETADGDFVDLDWVLSPASVHAPILLVLHGLEGSAASHYALGLLAAAAERGWRALTLNFRSCSGEPNRLPRFYHSGDTADLDHVVRMISSRHPDAMMGAVGVSLGGNVLLKWLGEQGEAAPRQVAGAVGISVPFDLEACARVLDRGLPKTLYTSNFLRTLRRKVRAKAKTHPGFVDVKAALRARTFAAYDRIVTAPLHGFTDERDYWRRSSSGPFLARIRRPVLLINALDDPFIPVASLPAAAALPPGIQTEFTAHGGHAGFLEGGVPWRPRSWAEARAVDFLEPLLSGGGCR